MKQQDKPPMRKIIKRILLAIGALFILFIAAILFMVYWRGSTKEIESIADQFHPPSSWRLESQLIRPPAIVCLDGGTCPELNRVWTIEGEITRQQLAALLDNAGWKFPIDSDCSLPKNISGPDVGICSASGTYQQYEIALSVGENSTNHKQRLAIGIRPAKY